MGDPDGSELKSATCSEAFLGLRRSPALGGAAMILFVVLGATWLVAATTARVWYHSAPFGYVFQPRSAFYTWVVFGVVGVVLALLSATRSLRSCRHRVAAVVVATFGAATELSCLRVATDYSMATARLGFNNAGEGAVAIATLVLVQFGLVVALVPAWGRSTPTVRLVEVRKERSRLSWVGVSGLAGMVTTCGAFVAWSLRDGTTLIVDTSLIAGKSAVVNVGAWWPGLFAAMAALTVMALVCAPGTIRRVSSSVNPASSPAGASGGRPAEKTGR